MRLFRVTGEGAAGDTQAAKITTGAKGPGIYVGSFHLPVEDKLQLPFQGDAIASLGLSVARLSRKDGNLSLIQAPKSVLNQVRKSMKGEKKGRYYGTALLHLDLPEGKYELLTQDFCTKLEEYAPGKNRVIRDYLPLVVAAKGDKHCQTEGIEVLHCEENQRQALFVMDPGAGFRVHRPDGQVLTITWSGLQLYATRPPRSSSRKTKKGAFGATMGEVINLHQKRA